MAQAIATRPFVLDRAQKAANALSKAYGDECTIEAVAVAAAFESSTKAADVTGKAPFDSWMLKMMYIVPSIIRWILKTLRIVT